MDPAPRPFDIVGPADPVSPVILSVPHGGRVYPPAMLRLLRIATDRLTLLEDRHVDSLARAARRDQTMLVARHGRCWIDLNRGEDERDPLLEPDARTRPSRHPSAKVRSGLGLIPRRTGATGDIWRRRLTGAEVTARIMSDHRPYHAAIAATIDAALRRFGVAVLIDLHSMPTLPGAEAPRLVVGDRFGRTASPRFADLAMIHCARAGIAAAVNAPYAGGHVVTRHGAPAGGVHALQIEVDRGLYLDALGGEPGAGLAAIATLLRTLLDGFADLADDLRPPLPIAAE